MRQRTRSQAGLGLTALLVAGLVVSSVAPSAGAEPGSAGVGLASSTESETPVIADDRLLVTVAPGTTDAAAAQIAATAGATLDGRAGEALVLDPAPRAEVSAAAVGAIPGVVTVEPNYTVTGFAAPNDPLYADQYGVQNTQPGGIRAESAWNNSPGTRDVVVGVLDTGIALSHPDLAANLWTNRTGINGCAYGTYGWNALANNCSPQDDGGHGSHVAGIVGAIGNNGTGVTGVAQRVSLMGLKMLDSQGIGSVGDAIEAIDFALDAKAAGVNVRVLQASWGTSNQSSALSAAIGSVNTAGVLFVAAAGNGTNNNGVAIDLEVPGNDVYPCEDTHTNVICVAATTSLGTLGDVSNYGATTVDIAAPGFNIVSTVPAGIIHECSTSLYCEFDGTSMAAPMVSGAAVDVLAAEPALERELAADPAADDRESARGPGREGRDRPARRVCRRSELRRTSAGAADQAHRSDRGRRRRLGHDDMGQARFERQLVHHHRLRGRGPGRRHQPAAHGHRHDPHRPDQQCERRRAGAGAR